MSNLVWNVKASGSNVPVREDFLSEEFRPTMALVVQEEVGEKENAVGRSRRIRRRGGDGEGYDEVKRCGMWLPSKRRFCASHARASSLYCGNHDPEAGKHRIPCPADPSHTILQEEIDSHVKKCQATKHLKFAEEQPYYQKGINGGSDGEEEEETIQSRSCEYLNKARSRTLSPFQEISPHNDEANGVVFPREGLSENGCGATPNVSEKKEKGSEIQSSAAKRAAISALSEAEFHELVRRIESSHEACSRDEVVEESFLQPPQCSQWWDRNRDKRLPFQEKHVSQQASMLGNLEAFGLLEDNNNVEVSKREGGRESRAYVEFGAGRGYLSQMLCDSYGVSSVVLVERKAYKYKADRTLRQLTGVSVERLRTDIEDLYINGVESLQGRRYVAVSKHLCGPATDMTLRCCLDEVSSMEASDEEAGRGPCPTLEGVGIATCCHHLCQWRSYVNKQFFRGLRFSEVEFHMITWLTSWAVNVSGEHAEIEHLELEMSGEQRTATGEISHRADKARPKLSEAMDAMDVDGRAELGRKCKHLIDLGRLLFLRRHGLEGKIVKYISASVSPENKLLLGRKAIV